MRTIYITLCLVLTLCFNAANAQHLTQASKNGLLESADSAYARMKYNVPTKLLLEKLTYFTDTLKWDSTTIRRVVFSLGHFESHGKIEAVSADGKDHGWLQVRESTVTEHFRKMPGKAEPTFTAADLSNPANGHDLVWAKPLELLNEISRKRKLDNFRDIVGVWCSGWGGYNRNPGATDYHFEKFTFTFNQGMGLMEEDGRAQICNPIPGTVLLQ